MIYSLPPTLISFFYYKLSASSLPHENKTQKKIYFSLSLPKMAASSTLLLLSLPKQWLSFLT